MIDYRQLARDMAARHAVPPAMFERQIQTESGFNPAAVSPTGAIGIAQFMPATARWLGVDPLDPQASLDAAAGYMSRLYRQYGKWSTALAAYNAGEGNVQKYGGVPPFPETRHYLDAILGPGWPEPATEVPMPTQLVTADDSNFRPVPGLSNVPIQTLKSGSPVWPTGAVPTSKDGHIWVQVALGPVGYIAQELLAPEPAPMPAPVVTPGYDPDTPMVTQQHDWDCAEQATWWALTAIGRHPSDAWMENSMLSAYVESTEVGLTDATGAKLAAWIRDQYGEFGIGAYNLTSPSFDDIARQAGTTPILAGARNWSRPVDGANNRGHWCGVRRFRSDFFSDVLELAQPGGHGPIYGQEAMDREGWTVRGPWSAVVITKET